ncbi:uncharacterized protein LOC143264868 isoform X2 [Megachile rotundata]|uniref:uncharacterized protein LOC143264868 isoform X2 n=1 Tax=Megachile rotundata TaxID=143995 RepID=UPI003FD3E44C
MEKRSFISNNTYTKYGTKWSVLLEQAKTWKISVLAYGAATIICTCWLTDWQAFSQ